MQVKEFLEIWNEVFLPSDVAFMKTDMILFVCFLFSIFIKTKEYLFIYYLFLP